MMNQAYQDVRNISHNLVPAELENKGLVGSIENLIIKINDSSRVQFTLKESIEDTALLQEISYPIYNIVFELINNILKLAEARKAHINKLQRDNSIVLVVTDDGQGYDPAKTKKGFGLKSILARVESLGGHLTATSQLGNGFTSKITIPLMS